MQKVLFSVLLSFAPSAYAGYIGPVVVKTNATGFVMPEWTRVETCELYQHKVVIKRAYGPGHVVSEERTIAITGSLLELSEKASKEAVREEGDMICDLPSTRVVAVRVLPHDATEDVPLFVTGACGSRTLIREGGASQILRDMVDAYCPLTHQGSVE